MTISGGVINRATKYSFLKFLAFARLIVAALNIARGEIHAGHPQHSRRHARDGLD